ncbi:hypothetical protein FHX57_001971 [Paraburkholderia tropica]|uniref:hypothetical protein n=1 Tax=Paraburkholderia tropica TaxID=92647 RepID=UPI001615AEDB|nr:hypothetical protein [Paraburkholderia tropica]MBB2999640.1 hypothetical protein [Paraburkholderia tropica]
MFNFIRGSTFQLVGQFQLDGLEVDCTGWTLVAKVHDFTGTTLIADLSVTWIDQPSGLAQLNAGDTSSWPVCKARIDIATTDDSGDSRASEPEYFRIGESPVYE